MAEFCFDCLKKMDPKNFEKEEDYIVSEEVSVCEGCGKMKHTVIKYREPSFLESLKKLLNFKF